MTRIIHALPEISNQYDAMFVDLWGCVHNGVEAYPDAIEALRAYRASGGVVVLVTNSPRSRKEVFKQIERFGVPEDAWDNIATSGDSARAAMFTGAVGNKVYFIGLEEERSFFEPLKIITDPVEIETVPLEEAEGIVCTGLFDATADPAAMRPQFLYAKQKGLKLLCANPDIVVDRGHRREWCAGALAALYTEMGGESLYFGKPHPPIYDLARQRLAAIGGRPDDRILCIGDGIATDVQGALGEGLDVIFITGGLAAAETRTGPSPEGQPEPDLVEAYLLEHVMDATYAIGYLR